MGQINFQTTGQALVIASSTATLYTDAAYSSPVTLPAAYAADTALYTREGSPTIVVTQPDGTVLFNGQVQVGTVYPAVLKPLPTFEQLAADVSKMSSAFPATADPLFASNSQHVGTATRTWFLRVLFGAGRITKLRVNVGAQSGNICASVYTNTGVGLNALPGTRVATTGSIACPASGNADLTLDATVNVTPGDYWFSLCADNTTATFAQVGTTGSLLPQGRIALQDSTLTGPATAAATANGSRTFVILGL